MALNININKRLCFRFHSCSSHPFLIIVRASKIPLPELSITCLATSVRVKINFLPEQQPNSSAEWRQMWQEQIAESRGEIWRERDGAGRKIKTKQFAN